ncbi:MAG: protein kinase [Woeseiaceae bacterium]|nr:protein kinase [Woeseiaceae bacterium]
MTTPEMTAERFARLREIYLGAGGLADDALDEYLDVSCGGDAALEREVRELLALGDPEERPLDEVIAGVARRLSESIAEASTPESVGPYRILETLGHGGMGTVYLAERDDGHFRQKVAVKVVDRNRATPELVTRFRAERQILAGLDHPNVARLFDGGETGDGVPYLVMEVRRRLADRPLLRRAQAPDPRAARASP